MGPSFLKVLLMVALPVVVVGTPLLVGALAFGLWLRRSHHLHASRPFLGAAISGAVSFLSMCGAIGVLCVGAVRDRYADQHPLWPVLMFGLLLLALATASIAAFFSVWTFWRVFAAPRALSPDAAAAAAAPARLAG